MTNQRLKQYIGEEYGEDYREKTEEAEAGRYVEYEGIPVEKPGELLKLKPSSFNVLFVLGEEQSESVRRQLFAYGISEAYNLRNLSVGPDTARPYRYDLPYGFTNRSRNKRYLRYILDGYEAALWNSALARIEAFQKEDIDYCLVPSGTYNVVLETIAERNNWSYLYTFQNQVCYIQNLAVELHPKTEYILKMDEDMFVGKEFFSQMIREFHQIEKEGEYRFGFAVPVIPLNCGGCMSYLKVIGKKEEYEERFGRLYRSRYCGIYGEEQAEFLWDTMENFDSMAERFLQNRENRILKM